MGPSSLLIRVITPSLQKRVYLKLEHRFMKKIFLLLLLIFVNLSFSQTTLSGEIVYKKTIQFPKPKRKTPYYEVEMKSINNSLDKLRYSLQFSGALSYFDVEKSMDLDIEKIHRIALSKGKGSAPYSTNLKTNTCFEVNDMLGKTFLVSIAKPKFKLVTETKTIHGYTCYKAITTEVEHFSKLNDGREDLVNTIEAWYTPEISAPFGPLNFFGLPGLILELKYTNVTYTAVDLKLKNKAIEIETPKKGKKITNEAFEDLIFTKMKEMRANARFN